MRQHQIQNDHVKRTFGQPRHCGIARGGNGDNGPLPHQMALPQLRQSGRAFHNQNVHDLSPNA